MMMKRRASVTTTSIFLMFLVIFLAFHQITIQTISRSSLRNLSSLEDKDLKPKAKRYWAAPSQPIKCDRSQARYDVCQLNGPTVIDPTTSTLFLLDLTRFVSPMKQNIRPYPRKWENHTMSRIKELNLIASSANPHCDYQHDAPALVFSAGGYTGNPYHDFDDGFIPLFITIRSIFPTQYPVLAIANCRDWWLSKYTELLKMFTPYQIINLDTDTSTHCFPATTIGLISHGFMTIDPKMLPNSETLLTFRALLGSAYLHSTNPFPWPSLSRPGLVLVGRTGDKGRILLNQAEVAKEAEQVGFKVAIFEPNQYTSISEAYRLINTSHAMLGVHGAALTHLLFLRPGSIFIQVVPIGTDWLAETCYGKPAKDIGLEYLEYKIQVEESSLLEQYGNDHLVVRNPRAVVEQGFSSTKNIYLKKQDVSLDLARIGKYLRKAHKKAVRFMKAEGQS